MNEEKNSSTPTEIPKKVTLKEIIKEIIVFAIIAFGIVFPFRIYVAEPYLVDGRSMDPTFATGDYLIVDKLSYEIGTPARNSVVVFRYPDDPKNDPSRSFLAKTFDPGKSFIKRIIGLPGETVIIKNDVVTIKNKDNPDGFVVDGSYVTHHSVGSYEKTLGVDEYYVLGDNRAESFDSRYWGVLKKEYLLGKPLFRLLPISKIGILPGNDKK